MTLGRLGGSGNGIATEKPCDSVLSGFTTETITVSTETLTVLEGIGKIVSVMTPGAVVMAPLRSEQHKMPGPCGWMIATAPGRKLLPATVTVTWWLCCVTFTLVIDGVGAGAGGGGGGGGGGVRVTADSGEADDPPHPASAAASKKTAAKQHHATNRFWRKRARSTKQSRGPVFN